MKKWLSILPLILMGCSHTGYNPPLDVTPNFTPGKYSYDVFKNGRLEGTAVYEVEQLESGYRFFQVLKTLAITDSFVLTTDVKLFPVESHRVTLLAGTAKIIDITAKYFTDSVEVRGFAGHYRYGRKVVKLKGKVFDYGELPYLLPAFVSKGISTVPLFVPENAKVEMLKVISVERSDSALDVRVELDKKNIEFGYKLLSGGYVISRIYNFDSRTLMALRRNKQGGVE